MPSFYRSVATTLIAIVLLPGCRPTAINDVLNGVGQGIQTIIDGSTGTLIRTKRTSALSQDLSTASLTVETQSPDGGDVSVTWQEITQFGTLNVDRGTTVQWAANPGVTGTAVIRIKAERNGKTDVGEIRLPVTNGKIKPAELTPEVSLSPQSATLFRPLPTGVKLADDDLIGMGIRTSVTLGPTTYTFDATTNGVVKQPYDPNGVRWRTSDPDLVVVGESGTVRPANGSKVGQATVLAQSKVDANQWASAVIKVQYLATKLDLAFDRTSVAPGGTLPLSATVTYSNPDDRGRVVYTDPASKDVTWESSDKTKAQVDGNGQVKALADAPDGSQVTITARSAYDPSIAEPVTLTVRR